MKTALQIGLTALLVGALAFYGGVTYGKASGRAGGNGANAGGFTMRFGQGGQNGANGRTGTDGQNAAQRIRGGFANGEVISADAKSITVKSTDGSTRTVYFDSNTRVLRSSEATLADLAKGATVVVVGAGGTDGSVTARSVQIVPKGSNLSLFGGGMRGFGTQGTQNGQGGATQNGTQGQQNQGGQGGPMMGGPGDAGGPPPGF